MVHRPPMARPLKGFARGRSLFGPIQLDLTQRRKDAKKDRPRKRSTHRKTREQSGVGWRRAPDSTHASHFLALRLGVNSIHGN